MRATRRRWRTAWCAAALPLLVVLPADAATLGGLTARSIESDNWTGSSGAATVLGCDNFTGTNGSTMASRVVSVAAACGSRTWTSHLGSWRIQSNQGSTNTTTNANATVDVSAVGYSVQVTLNSMQANNRVGGVVGSHNGTSTYLAAVLTNGNPDVAQIRLYQSGVPTVLASMNPSLSSSHTLAMTRTGASVTVRLDGTQILVATLSEGQAAVLGSGGRAGLFGGQASVRFDDFLVTSP